MYGYIISNYRIIVDTNIWMNYTIITYLYIIPNKNIWLDNGILPYFSSIRDHCGSGTERIKMLCKFIKISKRIVGYQKGLADRKSTRLNSSHVAISYAVFCLKKKKKPNQQKTTNQTTR